MGAQAFLHRSGNGRLLAQQIEQQHAKRIHIAAHVGLPITELLGRRIGARAEMAGIAHGIFIEGAGDAKVYHQDRISLHHEVRRLDIAMDERRIETAMQLGNGVAYAGEQPFRHINGRAGFVDLVGKRAPGHEFHHHRILFPRLIAVDDARQM